MYELDPVNNDQFLDLAVKRGLEATDLVQNEGESADTAVTFGTLARALYDRFREKLERIDFVDAVKNGERAIRLSDSRPADKATWMNNLGLTYYTSFDDSGDIAHLQKAIELFDQAANLARKGSISELRSTNNLAEALSRRFEWTGETEALDLAISKCRGLTESAAWNSLERAKFFRVFASILLRRRKRSLKDEDLDEAVQKLAESIKSYPAEHSDLSFAHSLLCTTLAHRYEIEKNEKNEKDIQSALEHGKTAIDKEIPGDPYAWTLFSDLALAYKSKWTVTKNDQDLDDAITYSSKCLRKIPSSTPYQAYQLFNHALLLTERILAHRTTISSEIFQEPLTYLQNAVALPQGVPLARTKAARGAIKIFATFHDWENAVSMGIEAIKLLPLVCGRYLSIQDQQQAISEMSGLTADVCSLLLQQKQPEKALLQLEIGRAVLLGYAMDYHEDLVPQSTESQHLKTEYDELRRKLRLPHDVERSRMSEVEMRKRRAAEIDIEKCLEQIRQIKGYEKFLQAPSLDEIKACSKDGPIILVNATSIRSDAIVVASSSLRAVELPDFQPENAPEFDSECIPARCAADDPWERGVKVLSRRIPTQPKQESFIEWLWHTCVKVVLEELKTLCPLGGNGELPRIWWIGSGKAAGFPFHAAGDLSGTDQNALALMIPSYAPSVKALLFSRQRSRNRQTPNTQKLTVVTMKTTPGELPLPEVDRERNSILEICQKDYECSELRQPQVDAVLKALVDTDIIHFACHGLANSSDPSQSHLLLAKSNGKEVDKLTVSKILSLESLQQAWISYLSSCSTARTSGSRFPDEGLHTTAALQIAGFAHVIGGLWKVGDDTCVDMAQNFYASLLKRRNEPQQDRVVAAALRDAVLHIREQDPSSWRKFGAYVHFGA
ncbi:CHAT domain-domain-containing protein [Clohesyomyces aquaticus]|uniref:CHAT domain-domain-containing protein n=1 Tax=Clohesyomyces aquaticus TaxID=1231657 RepID=A0A1Y1Y3F4_9PLEO|nr:CHAT domain-domain-containing protein [Clohesyomyces aquaticus]